MFRIIIAILGSISLFLTGDFIRKYLAYIKNKKNVLAEDLQKDNLSLEKMVNNQVKENYKLSKKGK